MSAVAIGFSNFCGVLISRIAIAALRMSTSIFLPSAVTSKPPASSSTGFSSRSVKSKIDDRALGVGGSGARQAAEEQLALDRLQIRVIAGRRRQHDGARLEAVEVDVDVLHLGGRLAVSSFLASSFFSSGFFSSGFFGLAASFEVVARVERRLDVLAQRHRDEAGRVGVGPAVVEAAVDRRRTRGRRRRRGTCRPDRTPAECRSGSRSSRASASDPRCRRGRSRCSRRRSGGSRTASANRATIELEPCQTAVVHPLRALVDLRRLAGVDVGRRGSASPGR